MSMEKLNGTENGVARGGEPEKPDALAQSIGEFGPWQTKLFFIVGFFAIPTCYPVLNLTFMNAANDFWCVSVDDSVIGVSGNLTLEEWRNVSGQSGADGDACNIYDVDYDALYSLGSPLVPPPNDTSRAKCAKWGYDRTVYNSTFTTEWDLVCDRTYLKSVAQTIFFLGQIAGVSLAGVLCDRYGRKAVLVPILIATSVVGLIAAYMPSFWLFVALRFIHALVYVGGLEIIFTYLLEVVSGKYTTWVGMGVDFFWSVGWMSLSLMAYYIDEWRHLLVATSLPGFLAIALIWWIPESPRWLISMGRIAEADYIVRKIAKANGKPLPESWTLKKALQAENVEKSMANEGEGKSNVMDLLTTPQMRWKTLILYFNWFINSLCYYGLTLNAPSYGLSTLMNFTINGLLEVPAYAFALFILACKGRRYPYFTSMILTGLTLLSIVAVPAPDPDSDSKTNEYIAMGIVIFGKFWITVSFASVFLYSAELYPTVVRTTGMGTSSTCARFGGMVCGWIALLSSVHDYLPPIIYGLLALTAGLMAIRLPETLGKKLPDTILEGEAVPLEPCFGCGKAAGRSGTDSEDEGGVEME